MEYFIKLAECASFTRAANELYISQPTLSRQIINLELELGVSLIDRSTKKTVRLTEEGEVFFREARKIMKQIYQLPAMLQHIGKEKFSVSIGYHSSFNDQPLHQTVADFGKKYPNIRINLKCCSSDALNKGLRDGDFDIILIAEFCMDNTLQAEKVALSEYELCAVVSSENVLASQSSVKLGSLSGERFVFLERSLSPVSLDRMTALCRESGFSPDIVEWFQDKPTLLVAVGAGIGISLTLSGCQMPHTVRLIPLSEPCVHGSYFAVYQSDSPNPATKPFMAILEQNFKGELTASE